MIAPYTRELQSPALPLHRGSVGSDVRRVQEWLCLHGTTTGIDGEFGPATEAAIRHFQMLTRLTESGIVDGVTWGELIMPLAVAAHSNNTKPPFSAVAVAVAKRHLGVAPREVGGDNKGPWVRHYCYGIEDQWCQGFASSMHIQAAHELGQQTPFPLADENGVVSLFVPWVVNAAKAADRFQHGSSNAILPGGSMAFVPGGEYGYQHVALVVMDAGDTVQTIEGNTNRDGSSRGYEVALRFRRKASCDYGLA